MVGSREPGDPLRWTFGPVRRPGERIKPSTASPNSEEWQESATLVALPDNQYDPADLIDGFAGLLGWQASLADRMLGPTNLVWVGTDTDEFGWLFRTHVVSWWLLGRTNSDEFDNGSRSASEPLDFINIYYQNVGGINSCVTDYLLATSCSCYDIITFTETWLNDHTLSNQIFGSDYSVFRCDRSSRNSRKATGGGVLLALRSKFRAMPIDDESWHNLEMVWSRIELGDRKLYVGVLYLPPDRSRDVTLAESFSSCISKISSFCAPEDDIIVLGDFNMPGIKWCSSQASFLYPDPERSTFSASSNIILDSLSTATLRQINSVVNENGRMLDLCFANDGFRLPTIESAPAPLVKVGPHHPALLVTINISRLCNPADKLTPFYLDYKNADFDIISRVLATIDWESELELANPNAAAETFSHILNYVIDRHVPKRTANANPRTPWATAALRQLKATKRRALRNFNKHKSPHTKEEYRKLNSAYKKACQRSYQNHLRRIQQNLKTSPKSFWNHVKNQRNEPGTPSCMFLDGIMANSDSGICDLFANKFSSIFDTSSITDDQLNRAIRSVSPLGFSLNDSSSI
ncbi:uncharacterized protein LOC129742401 [Uranotaenia lowii]|uniref:uncharacterized protein LOC129742401 n=1 Tax=Uranotaenia lowii TaxID=190385 RepID=UPI002479A72E|nr:uncharacterized protein LOC129742401 [Uranotaenia lowii]